MRAAIILPMRRRTKIVLVLGAIVVLALGWVLFKPGNEPRYHGKPLSYWVENLFPAFDIQSEEHEAIRQVGSNAIPYLLTYLKYESPPKWKNQLQNIWNYSILKIAPSWYWEDKALKRFHNAWIAFFILGPMAESAIPELVRMAQGPIAQTNFATPFAAVDSLSELGSKAVPALVSLATNPACPAHLRAIEAIPRLDRDALKALPALLYCVEHGDTTMARSAVYALARARLDPPDVVISMLTQAADDPRPEVCCAAFEVLPTFGTYARPALPPLRKRAAGTNTVIQIQAAQALQQIENSNGPRLPWNVM